MHEKLWTLWGEIKKRATVFVRESAKCVEVHAEKWSMDGRKRNCLCTEVLHQKNLLVNAEGTSEKFGVSETNFTNITKITQN